MSRFVNDMVSKVLQKVIYSKVYKGHKPNEWKPWNTPETIRLDNGKVMFRDVCYGNSYPNSYADIWLPDDTNKKWPVVVYLHGGGFIFGNKSSGDPLSAGEEKQGKLQKIIEEGYVLVNADYALAPQYRFPSQIRQLDELFRFLLDNADKYNLDMNRVCLSGGSAGANMTEIYAACVCNKEYADLLKVDPVMTKEKLKVLAIDEAALDASVYDRRMYIMLGCATGAKRNTPQDVKQINAKTFIKDSFIPSWINASNEGGENGFFITEARGLKKILDEKKVDNDMVYFPGENLPHGYMDNVGREKHADEAFNRMMSFIKKHI
ncbi:MAG: alpha/beta hydrolase [Erysipelotrichaceae bacterium]|nr:alpha/beta hydrolase [Erysipelotrichaceae bacterium]